MIRRQLINFQNRSVDVRVGLGAFEELSRMFASAVGKPKRAMVVWNSASSEPVSYTHLTLPTKA